MIMQTNDGYTAGLRATQKYDKGINKVHQYYAVLSLL